MTPMVAALKPTWRTRKTTLMAEKAAPNRFPVAVAPAIMRRTGWAITKRRPSAISARRFGAAMGGGCGFRLRGC